MEFKIQASSVLSIVIGLVAALYGGCQVAGGMATRSWPTTEGVVTRSSVSSTTQSSSTGRGRTRVYRARVEYDYEVDGVPFEGERITAKPRWTSNSRADAVAARYPEGSTVTVHYDPDSPESSVLETGASTKSFLWLGGGLFLALAGLAIRLGLIPESVFGSS